jgi:hypothetical protein
MRCGVAPHGRQGRAVLAMDARGAISRIHASERTAGSESIPGAAHQAEVAMHVPRVIPSVTRWPRLHARRLSLSRSSAAFTQWCLAAIKPHRRALHRTGSGRGREGDCRSPH